MVVQFTVDPLGATSIEIFASLIFVSEPNPQKLQKLCDSKIWRYTVDSTKRYIRLRDTRVRAMRNVLYLSSLTKNLWNEQREQLDSGGGGALSQGAGHDGSFYRYAV